MDEKVRSTLNDKEMLFALLTAIVKKQGGEIEISEDEMDSVAKTDMMMMYYDRKAKKIILSMHMLNGPGSDEVF